MTRIIHKIFFLLCVALIFCIPAGLCAAPNFEIPDGMVWLNSDRPIKISDLKGKFVLVYFWNYGVFNIQSVADQYRELQEKYPRELVIVSVHSGKALNEDDLNKRVVDAMRIYRMSYPVAVDNQLQTLKAFRFDRCPAAVLFSPDGSVLMSKTGERDLFYLFSKVIAKNLPRYQKSLDQNIIVFQSSENKSAGPSSEMKPAPLADLADKVLASKLMGNVILDKSENNDAGEDVSKEQPAAVSNETITGELSQSPMTFNFDMKKFVGEKILVDREYSQNIGAITLNFRLPDHAHLLGAVKSYARIFTDDHTLLAQGLITGLQTNIVLDKEILSERLNIEVMLHYCTEGNNAICRIKGILFIVPLAQYSKQENIVIEHEIATESL